MGAHSRCFQLLENPGGSSHAFYSHHQYRAAAGYLQHTDYCQPGCSCPAHQSNCQVPNPPSNCLCGLTAQLVRGSRSVSHGDGRKIFSCRLAFMSRHPHLSLSSCLYLLSASLTPTDFIFLLPVNVWFATSCDSSKC